MNGAGGGRIDGTSTASRPHFWNVTRPRSIRSALTILRSTRSPPLRASRYIPVHPRRWSSAVAITAYGEPAATGAWSPSRPAGGPAPAAATARARSPAAPPGTGPGAPRVSANDWTVATTFGHAGDAGDRGDLSGLRVAEGNPHGGMVEPPAGLPIISNPCLCLPQHPLTARPCAPVPLDRRRRRARSRGSLATTYYAGPGPDAEPLRREGASRRGTAHLRQPDARLAPGGRRVASAAAPAQRGAGPDRRLLSNRRLGRRHLDAELTASRSAP